MRGEKKDGSDAKKVKETVEVPKNPKNAVVLDCFLHNIIFSSFGLICVLDVKYK